MIRSVLTLLLAGFLVATCRPVKENVNAKLIIKGSETELFLIKRYADAYKSLDHHTEIIVTGGGSGVGLQALRNNETDIANSSRIITEEEQASLARKGVKWIQAIIGVDAIAIITHPSLHLNYISLYQLSAIYSGKITNWKQIGGPDKPIHLYGRKPGSGTHDFMKHRLSLDRYAESIREFEVYEDIMNGVSSDPYAIGYVSSSCIRQNVSKHAQSVFVMNVFIDNSTDYSPFDDDAISTGDYPLIRPLFQYYDASSKNTEISRFIQFELSEQGQALLKLSGYYPVNVFHRQINDYNGLAI